MNILKIQINDSGGVSNVDQDFKILKGSYKDILINLEVPKSLLVSEVTDEDGNTTTGNSVRVGAIIHTATGKVLKTKSFEFSRVKDYTRNSVEYRQYQRLMPKEFTMWETQGTKASASIDSLNLVFNVVNFVVEDGTNKVETITATPKCNIQVYPSDYVDDEEDIEASDFDNLNSQVQEIDARVEKLEEPVYASSINLSSVQDMEAANVQEAIEELNLRTDSQHVDTVTGEDGDLVDNTDTYNPVILHDKTKVDKSSIADDLTTQDSEKVLSANQGAILKTELDDEINTRQANDNTLQENIDAETTARKTKDEDLQNQITDLDTNKANKTDVTTEINEAISAVKDSAPEAFDTLKEIADWIESDETGTAALVARVTAIETKDSEQDETLTAETTARESKDTELQANITAEETRAKGIEENLQASITTNATDITNLTSTVTNNATTMNSHIGNTSNPHSVTKAQVGLGNVDDTSDADKPISTATQTALDTKVDKVDGKGLSTNDFTGDYKTQVEDNTTARHTHANKDLLDTYTQTEANLADAVIKKHNHSNSAILDAITASYTTGEQTKLAGIEAGAEVNVQADWEQTDTTADDYIKNKPNIPDGVVLYSSTGTNTDGAMTQQATTELLETETTARKSADTLKVDIAQGSDNANKIITTDANGDISPTEYVYVGDIKIYEDTDTDGTISLVFEFPD